MASPKMYDVHAVGKRKTSIARVYMVEGTGKIIVNKRELNNYFVRGTNRYVVKQALKLLDIENKYDVVVNVSGGGNTGQAGAVRLGISRALCKLNLDYRPDLKKAGFMTRDARKVERKKYGLRGARRAFQFSKR